MQQCIKISVCANIFYLWFTEEFSVAVLCKLISVIWKNPVVLCIIGARAKGTLWVSVSAELWLAPEDSKVKLGLDRADPFM